MQYEEDDTENISTSSTLPSATTSSTTKSPASFFSSGSSSSEPSVSQGSQKKRKTSQFDDLQSYVGAIESIADSLRQPQSIPSAIESRSLDPVDSCVRFLGSILKEINCEELKLDVMNTLVQTVINAKTNDIQKTQINNK